jgi:hypothetical protein
VIARTTEQTTVTVTTEVAEATHQQQTRVDAVLRSYVVVQRTATENSLLTTGFTHTDCYHS